MNSDWYVYILRCADGTLYTGVTIDPQRREREHNTSARRGAKYTRVRRPVALIYTEIAENRSIAAKREYEIKQLSKADKEILITSRT